MISVRRAEIKDIPMIMQFLDDHWLKGYALAHNRELFDWQFVRDGQVNIWIGVDDDERKMYAMQGMISYSRSEHPDISGMLWVAIKSENPLLGVEVMDAMIEGASFASSHAIGMLKDSVRLLKIQGTRFTTMDHYYRLADRTDYKIAVVKNKSIPGVPDCGYIIKRITDFSDFQEVISEEKLMNGSPQKDYDYIKWRYWNHPVFHYDKWAIANSEGKDLAVLITREERANNSKACKIIDYYGNEEHLGKLTVAIDRFLNEYNYEYIDVYSYGVSTEVYEESGFLRCEVDSENIIPNFFQPYVAENSDIVIIPPKSDKTRYFRGDSDQDKPRLL